VAGEEALQIPPGPPGTVPITSFSVDEAVQNGTFRWGPVLIDRSPRPEALYLMWRSFQVVFDQIADRHSFPPLPDAPADEDLVICRRYIAAAEELAESELFCADDKMTVRLDDETGEENVTSSFTSKEITRGFSVLLRQFDSQVEPASFQRVSGRLRKLSAEMVDSHERRRCEQIDAWRKAQGALHGTELPRLARRKIAPEMEYGNDHPPTYYLSAYNYGELIHWDSGRETLAGWAQDPLDAAHTRMAFLEAATGLAYVYIGFSAIVRRAIGA
jgi:hypothetical protein